MGSIYKRGETYWIKYYRAGQPFRESSRSARKRDAVQLLHQREGHLAAGRPFSPDALRLRFEDVADDLRNDYRSRGLRTLQDLNIRLAHLAGMFAGWRARNITTDAIRAYITNRQDAGASPATINRELSVLRRALNLAIEASKLFYRPHVPMLKEDNVRCGFFEREQFERVRAELPDRLYGVITFAFYLGWRKGEIVSLRWPQVDLAQGSVRLEPGTTKNREGRTVFVPAELRDVLQTVSRVRVVGCDHVFRRAGKSVGDFKRAWKTACRRAGCPHMLFHDLRRTAVRNMVRAGIPERVAMQISGHKTRAIFDRYHIVAESDLREAATRLTAWNGVVTGVAVSRGHNVGTILPGGTRTRAEALTGSPVDQAS